ncbi:MAG: Plug domain-containing protein [Muribaculaceae bacterium]|nr:Plug domain-containing protein [Muribaculaceae bacterium]
MKRILFFVIGLLLTILQGFSQITVSGRVITADGSGVDMANVIAIPYNSPHTILSSSLTDGNGYFSMSVTTNCDSLTLTASGMDIAPVSITIPNLSSSYDIVTTQRAVELKEIIVKSKKIYSRGDTINYNVTSFLSQNDQTIADVLRKMPGITVSDAGQIAYQGKPIKNFYIEGLDLMKGHYGIATNNLDPTDIATVQVLEHHQDIKALKDLRPEEQASINLKLKKGIQGVFNLIATLGAGYSDNILWNNSAMATYFRRNSQFLATYKSNNTGDDLSQELCSFDDDYTRTSNITSVTMPSAPGIDKRFYFFNRSHNITFNNVYRVGSNGELGINTAYLNDCDSRQSYSSTSNPLPDGSYNIVDEYMAGTSRMQKAYGDLTFMNNNDSTYLKEQLKFDWTTTHTDSDITTSGEKINQTGNTDTYRLLNRLHLTHRSSEHRGFEINSLINLERRPHSLSVSPNLFPALVNDNILSQNVDFRNISTENSAGFLSALTIGNIILHPSAIINYHHNSLNSLLTPSIQNDLCLDYFETGLGLEASYRTRRLYTSFYILLYYKRFQLSNQLNGNITTKNCFHPEPTLSFTYNFTAGHHLNVSSSISYLTPSIETLYSDYILTSYRQLSVYNVTGLYEGLNQLYSLRYTFRNILSMSFAGLDLSWSRQSPDILYGSYYDGITQRTISRRTSESGDVFSVAVNVGQGFDWRHLKIGASASYSHYDSPLLVQDEIIRYSGNSLGLNADISLTPFRHISMSYQGSYFQSATRQRGFESTPWLRTFTNRATIDFTIPGGIIFTASLYHYYNNFNYGDKSFILLNAETRYLLGRFGFSLSLDNLLNRKSYLYSTLSALTESKAAYVIRPRSILFKIRFRIL